MSRWKLGGASALDVDEGEGQATLWSFVTLIGGMALFSYGAVSTDGMLFTVTGIVVTLIGVEGDLPQLPSGPSPGVRPGLAAEHVEWMANLCSPRPRGVGGCGDGCVGSERGGSASERSATWQRTAVVVAAEQGSDGVTYTFTKQDDADSSGTSSIAPSCTSASE